MATEASRTASNTLERRGAVAEEDPRASTYELLGDSAVDRPTRPVDDGVLVLQQHFHPHYLSGCGRLVGDRVTVLKTTGRMKNYLKIALSFACRWLVQVLMTFVISNS